MSSLDPPPLPSEETPLSPERRAALERLGRYAAYVPPVVLTLLVSQKASAESPIGGGNPPGGGPP